jgi:hypothetical protein
MASVSIFCIASLPYKPTQTMPEQGENYHANARFLAFKEVTHEPQKTTLAAISQLPGLQVWPVLVKMTGTASASISKRKGGIEDP